jgi:hypothetical protein
MEWPRSRPRVFSFGNPFPFNRQRGQSFPNDDAEAALLRAQNLMLFVQVAEGVDNLTWEHHLKAGHYSEWFREVIKDAELAQAAAEVEKNANLDAAESLKRISEAVTQRYTAPWKASET